MPARDTIVALASGSLPCGVAIIRISGPQCTVILDNFLHCEVKAGSFCFRNIYAPHSGDVIDQGLVAKFIKPHSFTGEDVVEFHVHGSVAIVSKLLSLLTDFPNVRLAKAGEFTRRSFDNGKLDLSRVEAISDLIDAETESQRVLALARLQGNLSEAVHIWRERLIGMLAVLESNLDFSDEDDVDIFDSAGFRARIEEFKLDLKTHLSQYESGRLIREGFRVGIGGLPNVGKSSVFNVLSGADVAIVTSEAGTTRDIHEIRLNIDGQLFVVIDSAGIRDSKSVAETIGVNRALEMFETCDLVIWVSSPDIPNSSIMPPINTPILHVSNKNDLYPSLGGPVSISAKRGEISALTELLQFHSREQRKFSGPVLISRERDKDSMLACIKAIDRVHHILDSSDPASVVELIAEELRLAIFSLERMIGKVGSEEILGELFSNFCIGK